MVGPEWIVCKYWPANGSCDHGQHYLIFHLYTIYSSVLRPVFCIRLYLVHYISNTLFNVCDR